MIISKKFQNANFDNYLIRNNIDKELIEALKSNINFNMIIVGSVGTGKTRALWSLYNSRMREINVGDRKIPVNDEVKIITINELLNMIRGEWKGEGVGISEIKNFPILCIEEIGIQYDTDATRRDLFEIFDYRYNQMLPTIITSNLSKKKVTYILGQRISDRLLEECKVFEMWGESMRGNKCIK